MVNKLQEWRVSPVIEEDEALRLQEEDNLEYCLTLLPTCVFTVSHLQHSAHRVQPCQILRGAKQSSLIGGTGTSTRKCQYLEANA